MGTNSSSIVSKRSVERLYYPEEPHFFRFFVNKFQRRAPLINRGYLLRLKVIDTLVRQFLEEPSSRKKVVVNLGCGSDVLPWQCNTRYPELSQDVLFVDVDFPDLMDKKRKVVLGTPELRQLLGSHRVGAESSPIYLRSEKYCQIGCDLRQLDLLRDCLSTLIGSPAAEGSFLFVAEVSITYLETLAADQVIQWAGTLGNANFCLLEQILPDGPDHPFAQTMLKHFDKLKTPLRSVLQYPTVHSQEERFVSRGWSDVQSWTLWEAWSDGQFMSSAERKSLDHVEPFDEWEELSLFASHYIVVLARTKTPSEETEESTRRCRPNSSPSSSSGVPPLPATMTFRDYPSGRGQRRFAAAMLTEDLYGQSLIYNVMGQGPRSRLGSCDIHGAAGGSAQQPLLPGPQLGGPSARVCHTLTDLGALGVLLVGGRTSPAAALQDCWLYKKVVNRWERVHDLPVPLFRHSVLRLGSSALALLAGGKTNHHSASSHFYLYHPENGWVRCRVQGVLPALFGLVLTELPNSEPGSYRGLLYGGMLEDGILNEQAYTWKLDLADSQPLLALRPCSVEPGEGNAEQQTLHRFGAFCIPQGEHSILLGGVVARCLLPRESDMLVLKGTSSGFEAVARLVDKDNARSLRPFSIGGSVVGNGEDTFSILGGGMTCFSMGSFWSKGNYTVHADIVRLGKDTPPPPPPPAATGGRMAANPATYLQTTEIVAAADVVVQGAQSRGKTTSGNSSQSTTVVVRRVKVASQEEFNQILETGKPVIIEGVDVGSCVARWTPEYLVSTVGAHRKVLVHDSTTEKMDFNAKNFSYATMSFEELIREAQAGRKVYLRALSAAEPSNVAAKLETDFPGLAEDFRLPTELGFVSDNEFSSILRISGPVNMWLHYDVMANVYVQVKGTKRLMLFPPGDLTRLGFAPGASSSSVDVFGALEQGLLGTDGDGTDGDAGVHPHEAAVGAGDILYLPPLWLHTAQPTTRPGELSVAVNVFFRSMAAGWYATGRDIYGNRDLGPYEKGRQDVAKLARSLCKLPREAAGFYADRLAEELRQSVHNAD
ncbi:LCM-domain-containing protein [Sodiomyces alkalinus F11]|uniref:tRNA wybutosine-synthesizing protein 4 n=1 Tax=Sodiomyces alkalinus (strain CBS 110278 / VKM F-3762 / F11) TaxID=1314773 RepID=A0A3N2PKB6_SODAK|nr:LCM-domain-containing protein [Sodiomyces alkalinus F11]ROT34949.1 LCM-domain-containing protein [Sodiomyces alkalinus F11]